MDIENNNGETASLELSMGQSNGEYIVKFGENIDSFHLDYDYIDDTHSQIFISQFLTDNNFIGLGFGHTIMSFIKAITTESSRKCRLILDADEQKAINFYKKEDLKVQGIGSYGLWLVWNK